MKYSDQQRIRKIYEYAFKLQAYIRESAYSNKVVMINLTAHYNFKNWYIGVTSK